MEASGQVSFSLGVVLHTAQELETALSYQVF